MSELPHQPCPYTDCASSDAFSWSGEGYGKCHACGESYPAKGMKGKLFEWAPTTYPIEERKPQVMKEVAHTTYDGIRGLLPEVAQLYGIQRQVDEDGEWVRDAFRYPTNVKYRSPDKKFTWKERGQHPNDLFGPEFNAGSSKKLYITEGEYDAASLYQIMGQSFPVKSLPSGSIGDKFVKHNHKYLSSFEQIIYAGELDDTGRKAAERLYQAYPEKFYYVSMTKWKDANEFLTEGDGNDLKWAALKPQRYSPDNFFCSSAEFLSILREENPYEAIPTGHSGLDGMIRGVVKGGVTFIKAPPGAGKTELVRYFERAMLEGDDTTKIAMLHMEEMKSTTLRAMATYELGKNVRTKEDQATAGLSDKEVEDAALKATKEDRSIIFEMRSHDDPMMILEYCRLACGVYGASVVYIDHVQRLTYLGGTDGATSVLTQIGSNLAQLAKELNVAIVVISHVSDSGHTKYAKSLEEEAIICIKIERDKESDDDTIRNTTKFVIEKNRPYSKLGDAGYVYYDPDTTMLTETIFDV
jgi:twinkle protein